MRRMADDLGVGEQVTWTGFVGRTDGPPYWASDVFALPSSNEGMPNALMEAMASGLPSVITPIPGSSIWCAMAQGTFVEPDAQRIADALEQYIRSPQLRRSHGRAARKRAVEHFSARRVLDRHIQLYKRVLDGKDAAEN